MSEGASEQIKGFIRSTRERETEQESKMVSGTPFDIFFHYDRGGGGGYNTKTPIFNTLSYKHMGLFDVIAFEQQNPPITYIFCYIFCARLGGYNVQNLP